MVSRRIFSAFFFQILPLSFHGSHLKKFKIIQLIFFLTGARKPSSKNLVVNNNDNRVFMSRSFRYDSTLVPEVFLIFHRISRSCKGAAKQRERSRKTSGYFGLESHFHTDALTLELGLVIFTNTQINSIGPFD